MKNIYEVVSASADMLDDGDTVMAAQGLDKILWCEQAPIDPQLRRFVELARMNLEENFIESAIMHLVSARLFLREQGDINARVCHAFEAWHDEELVSQIYDNDDSFPGVVAGLIPEYEYPDISGLTVKELRAYVERHISVDVPASVAPAESARLALASDPAPAM